MAVELQTNPYSKPAFEDGMGLSASFSLRELREHDEKVWQEGYQAAMENQSLLRQLRKWGRNEDD